MVKRRRIPRYQREQFPRCPPAAKNRIGADLSKQAPNNSYSARLYYEDMPFTCVDCGREEVWTAAQQQWWYEVAQGSIYTTAIRCRACRQARRQNP